MSREPRRLADAGLDPSPDAAFLSNIIHAHRNGRPDAAKMDELGKLVGPFLSARVATSAHVPARLAPMLMSALLVASAAWLVSSTDDAPASGRASATTAQARPSDVLAEQEGSPSTEAPTTTAAPATPALSVHALPDLDAPAPPETTTHAVAGEPRRAAKSKAVTRSAASVCDDVELIERAGSELRSGQAARALATTRQHEERCTDGFLVQERERIAIEALAVLGRTSEARARASSFEARYPSSPHLRRVRQVVAAIPK